MENDGIVGGVGDPFATLPASPSAASAAAAPASGAPADGAAAAPQYVTREQFDAQQVRLARLEPLEKLSWVGDALSDPATRNRVMQLLAGNGPGAAPQYGAPTEAVDPAIAIKAKYMAQANAQLAAGDMAGYSETLMTAGAEIAAVQGRLSLEAAAAPVLNLNAQTAIESFFNNKRNDPRVGPIFAKLEPKLREFIGRTSPADIARMVQTGTLMNSLEGAFKIVLADTYIDGHAAAAAAGKLGPGVAAQHAPPYGNGGRGGSPDSLQIDDKADDADDKAFLDLMDKSGVRVKFTGNASGSNIYAEME
jgi:hypothetical protein